MIIDMERDLRQECILAEAIQQPRKQAGVISVLDLVEELDGTNTAAWRRFEPHLKNANEAIENLGPLPPAVAKGFIAAHQIIAERAKYLTQCRDQLAEIVLADAMARIARDEEKRSPSANADSDLQSPDPTEPDVT